MYTEDYKHNGFFFRNLLLKLLLIIAIIFLLIWIIPKFTSYKKSNSIKSNIKVTEENTTSDYLKSNLEKLKQASLVYYKDDKLPTNTNDIVLVTLKQLEDEKLITKLTNNKNKACNNKKSYVKLTKLADDYLLKVYINCDGKTDYLLSHVGKYTYCTNTICEKNDSLAKEDNEQPIEEKVQPKENKVENKESEEKNSSPEPESNNSSTPSNSSVSTKLSEFGPWSEYTRTSCQTKAITCNSNDRNCLTEIKLKRQTEQVGKYDKEYYTTHLILNKISTTTINACSNYNYISIQGTAYKTTGNYEEILTLNNKQSTNDWTYQETISTTTTPNFGANKYYKFVGADFTNCTYTCTSSPSYYYDVYVYNKPIFKVTGNEENCIKTTKVINSYSVVKKRETSKREEPLYATACYQSTRTRKIVK